MDICPRLTPQARLALTIALAFSGGAAYAAERADLEAPTVEVVGTTPVPGLGTPLEQVPSNVQVHTGTELQRKQTINLPDFMIQYQRSAEPASGPKPCLGSFPDFDWEFFLTCAGIAPVAWISPTLEF